MENRTSRRRFLKMSIAGGLGGAMAWPLLTRAAGAAEAAAAEGPDFCVTLCNHWSYIGIGWQLGIESCMLAVHGRHGDGRSRAPREDLPRVGRPGLRVHGGEVPGSGRAAAKYLAEGKIELIGGSYAQPMGTTVGGESNIRQIVVGRETIRKALGYDVATMLHEEEFTHPQLPQLAALPGYRYASLAQVDTWGRAGCPSLDYNVISWKGIDGTTVSDGAEERPFRLLARRNKWLKAAEFKKLKKLGKPMVFCWEEFGWESPETPAYLSAPAKYMGLAKKGRVEFVTLREYLDKYGTQAKETVFLPMDAWNKSLHLGAGRRPGPRHGAEDGSAVAGGRGFDAAASSLGGKSQVELIEKAWKDLLASQSHDVGLCEYSRWQGDRMAPAERLEDRHNFAWGVIGYNHLDAAEKQCRQVLDATLADLGRRIGSAPMPEARWRSRC